MKNQLQEYRHIKEELVELDRLTRTIERHGTEALRAQYEQKRAALEEILTKVETALESLDPTERTLLRLRYIEGKSWTQVSYLIHYQRTQVFRIHARALEKLQTK